MGFEIETDQELFAASIDRRSLREILNDFFSKIGNKHEDVSAFQEEAVKIEEEEQLF